MAGHSPVLDFSRIAWRDARGLSSSKVIDDVALRAAEDWLRRAQDASGCGGVSYGYSLRGGWRAPYPETSGYIATTFFRLGRERDPTYRARALRIVEWLLTCQNADGSFANPRYGTDGIVFDTGQILFGLVAGYEEARDARFLDAARRAAAWLTGVADGDLRWTRNEHLGTPHVYNTRTAWALLRMNEIEYDTRREEVARSNLDWAVSCQRPSGFFDHCAFREGDPPFTHTLAYATRGLLEASLLIDSPRYRDAARKAAHAALERLRPDGFLASTFTPDGQPTSRSCCLTGNCQFGIVWAKLDELEPATILQDGLIRALCYVRARQEPEDLSPGLRGAIPGSHPIWGRYAPLTYPNWATKFFVDAMWLLNSSATTP
jgi:Squalene-hopene cyclase C-terminal domain